MKAKATKIVAKIFGGNDSNQVASALAGTGLGGGNLIKKLLPILAPIVLAYVGKQFSQRGAAPAAGAQAQAAPSGRAGRPAGRPSRRWRRCGGGGGLGSILGSVLGGQQRRRDRRRFSAACLAARGSRSVPRSPRTPHGVLGAFACAGVVSIECCGDRQFEFRSQPGPTPCPSAGTRARWRASCIRAGWTPGTSRPTRRASKPAYSIVLPPPNVTGSLHMGHALDHTLMDALTRRKRMQGYEVLWLPGMDHAGIATQSVVEKQLAVDGKTKEDFGRELFIDKVWDWKRESGGTIGGQMRRLGDGVDWSRDRFTMDEGLSRAVRTIFKRLYDAGLIYRAERLVNWSPVLQTAISDLEVKYEDVEGELVSFRYGSLRRRRAAHRGGHHPRGDDARRHRGRGAPRRRALPAPGRHDAASTRSSTGSDPDRRRRPRRPRIRHRRSEDHPRPRPQRLRDRAAAQPADADHHGQAGPDRRHRNASSTAWTGSRRASRSARRWPSRAASSPRSGRTCTASGTPSAAASRSSRGCRCSGGSRSSRWPRPPATRCATATP